VPSQVTIDGMTAQVVPGYQFPLGDVYTGKILFKEQILFSTQPKKSAEECNKDMIAFLDSQMASLQAEIVRMSSLKKKMENCNE